MPTSVDTSVVIATCSRAGMLQACLKTIVSQQPGFSFDIVVVDDGSTDNTQAVLAEFQQQNEVPLTVVAGSRLGVAAARNAGSAAARGAWIASFDDDQLALPGWLKALRAAAEATGADCVGGELTLYFPDRPEAPVLGERVRRVLGEHRVDAAGGAYPHGTFPATNNVLFRRALFEQLGGFDVRYVEGGEDSDFFRRARLAGAAFWQQPEAKALHVTPAARSTRENLRWTSLRLGASDARQQMFLRGRFGAFRTGLLRVAVALLRDVPQLVWATLRGNTSAVRDAQCSLWYTAGLWRSVFVVDTAREADSPFLRSLNFRARNGERREAQNK